MTRAILPNTGGGLKSPEEREEELRRGKKADAFKALEQAAGYIYLGRIGTESPKNNICYHASLWQRIAGEMSYKAVIRYTLSDHPRELVIEIGGGASLGFSNIESLIKERVAEDIAEFITCMSRQDNIKAEMLNEKTASEPEPTPTVSFSG
jgi:hypothetical protein